MKTIINLTYHIILNIKPKLLDKSVFDSAEKLITSYASENQWKILELSFQTTQTPYLDLLIKLPDSISVDSAIKLLKKSCKVVPWKIGYFVETVGDFDLNKCELCLKNKAKNNKNVKR